MRRLIFNTEVIDEQMWDCPAGTVVHSTPVGSEQEALSLGGTFVPLSGSFDVDFEAVERAKAQLVATEGRSYGLEQSATLGCDDRSFSRSVNYYAYKPGVQVYSTVYYYQEYTCASGLSSAVASLSWNADLYWRFAEYFSPYYYTNDHGCTNLSTGITSDNYRVERPLGHVYRDESINFYPCFTAWGDSYTNSVTL